MTSLNHYNNLCFVTLDCPTKSASGSVDSYCKSQETAIKNAKEELKTLESNNSDQTDEIKKQIAEQNAKIKKAQDAKNDCAKTHYLPEDEREKGLEEVRQQRTIVDKLKKFAESLTEKNSNNNILTHLCTGLETFLGFNSTSKGYDGTGIVYSDLDRLCDGVMGFLSGVLGAVKNENEVTTYDTNNGLSSVLKKLKDSIGSGREGLVASVDAVREWLEGYESQLNEKTGNVIIELSWLQDHLPGKYLSTIHDTQGLESQLAGWTSTVEKIAEDVKHIETDVNILDNALGINIMHEIRPVKKVVAHMKSVAENEEVKRQATYVDEQLKYQRATLEKAIDEMSTTLQMTLDGQFKKTSNMVALYKTIKWKHFQTIRERMKAVQQLLQTIKEQYVPDVSRFFREIKMALQDVDPTNTDAGASGGNSNFHRDVTNIHKSLDAATIRLGGYILRLQRWMDDTKDFINDINEQEIKKIEDEVNGGFGSRKSAIEEIAVSLRQKGEQIYWHFHGAQDAMTELESAAKQKVNELEDHIKLKLGGIREEVKRQLEGYVRGYLQEVQKKVKEIVDGNSNGQEKGLKGVNNNVKTYADQFSKSRFESTVEKWILEILKEEPFKEWVGKYVSTNKKKNVAFHKQYVDDTVDRNGIHAGLNKKIASEIKEDIKKKLSNEIFKSEKNFPEENGSIDEYVEYIKCVCNSFADRLIKAVGVDVSTVVANISQAVHISGQTADTIDLRNAVFFVFHHLVAAARKAGDEVAIFAITERPPSGKLATNVHGALTTASELNRNFDRALSAGSPFTPSIGGVQNPNLDAGVKPTIDSIIDGKLPSDPPSGVGVVSVKVDVGQALTDYKAAKQRVENAIGEIRSKVLTDYESGRKGMTGSPFPGLSTDLTMNLEKLVELFSDAAKNVKRDLKNMITYKIYGSLTEIKNHIADLHVQNVVAATNAIQDTLERIKSVEVATTLVEGQENMATELMDTLYGKLENKIYAINMAISEADSAFNKSIKNVQNTLVASEEFAKQGVDKLKRDLHKLFSHAFTSISKEVRSLFADAHKADLSALRSLVDQQLKAVQGIIEKDKVTGVKGMLKTLSGVPAGTKHTLRNDVNLLTEISKVLPPPGPQASPEPPTPDAAKKLSDACPVVEKYFRSVLGYTAKETRRLLEHVSPEENKHFKKVEAIYNKLKELFDHLENPKLYAYDQTFVELRNDLNDLLTALHPSSFADSPSPLLAPLKAGLRNFAAQLGHAYVNRYSGQTFKQLTTRKDVDNPVEKNKKITVTDLTLEGRNCAKVCLTIVEMVHDGLEELKTKCSNAWYGRQINSISSLGSHLKRNGYIVSTGHSNQDGELRNKGEMMGQHIIKNLIGAITGSKNNEHLQKCKDDDKNTSEEEQKAPAENKDVNVMVVLDCFFKHIRQYNEVGHFVIHPRPRTPCSIYEMLVWFTGLTYNRAYQALQDDGFTDLLVKPKKQVLDGQDEFEVEYVDKSSYYIEAYPQKITYEEMIKSIDDMCTNSHELLTTILGTGDQHTTYTCDYSNNSLGLFYPRKGDDCLHTILDILRRLFPVLSFLRTQCSFGASDMGWADCRYGKDIPTTKSHCSKESKAQAKCQAECQPNYKPNCQPTSPLMCYLGDSLLGCLPHRVESVGCSSKCATCPSGEPGMPCLTPLGFRSFSGSTKTGSDLCEVVSKFFGRPVASCLFSLVAKPPSTLPEHFGFALSLVKRWDDYGKHLIEDGITSAITDRSIGLYDDASQLTNALSNAYGSSQSGDHAAKHTAKIADGSGNEVKKGDLASLAMSTVCRDQLCAPYLYALCTDQYDYLASKQCNAYLSWAVYLPWTFWNYLNSLYDSFKDIYCQDWGCRTCLRADTCRRGQHGLINDKTKVGNCHCDSMVECKGVMPTLYKYGFSFGSAGALNAENGKKTCTNFMDQLNNVLQSTYFQTLFEKCDDFLWQIRQPFTWTVVALWLLSFLYLLHIMVIRLDLLHIKSHLHSPSSHRIAAQSLLAAGRVNKLNRVFYLQP